MNVQNIRSGQGNGVSGNGASGTGSGAGSGKGYVEQVAFDRFEMAEILAVYGRYVAAGIWRDYGISCLRERAVFAIFRRAAENPLYRVEKIPALRQKQGLYALIGPEGQVLKRGATLRGGVLAPLERKLLRALD